MCPTAQKKRPDFLERRSGEVRKLEIEKLGQRAVGAAGYLHNVGAEPSTAAKSSRLPGGDSPFSTVCRIFR
jgi:hypothetical protein